MALERRGGAARWSDVVAATSVEALGMAVEARSVLRVPGGVYAVPGTAPEIVAAAVHRGRLTCVSAASRLGLAVLHRPPVPHLAVPRSRGTSPSAVREAVPARLHRGDVPYGRTGDVADVLVPVVHALVRVLLCQPAPHALVTVDSALHQGLATKLQIRAALPRTVPSRVVTVLRQANGRSRSPTETLARLALSSAGLRTQAGVPVPGVGEVDLVVEGAVVVELDGFAYHSDRRQFREDRRRDRELVAQGFSVVRFTFEDVVATPELVVLVVKEALAARMR